MKIRRQIFVLGIFIVAIPLLCFIFICVENYFKSPKRLLIHDYRDYVLAKNDNITEQELSEIKEILINIPPETEFFIISEDSDILISTMENFPMDVKFSKDVFFSLLRETSLTHIYQFTKFTVSENNYFLISRITKNHRWELFHRQQKTSFSMILFGFLFVFILICIIIIIYLGHTISNSITMIEEKTSAIAEGNLTVKIETEKEKYKENEITSIANSLEKMRISLLEAQNQKNKFIMGISHDLRTPVAIIKGYTEALQDGIITEENEVKKTQELILSKTNQLENMIDTLLSFMKLNASDLRNKLLPESIAEVITYFASEAQITGQAFKRTIKININLPPEDIKIFMDKQLIIRAFENIFSNAMRYTKDGDLITFSANIVETSENEKELHFSIEDTGVGISEEDLDNIFDLFYRGTNSRREIGLGVGLSVVKNIIETHGWKIDVTSQVNKGSCFTIKIPLE